MNDKKFLEYHPQYTTCSQICHQKDILPILTLNGVFLRLDPDSTDESVRANYFCLLSALFLPWSSRRQTRKPDDISWEQYFENNRHRLQPWSIQHIANINLLHKSKQESIIDRLQRQAQAADGLDSDSDTPSTDDEMAQFDDGSDNDEELSDSVTVTRAINEYIRYDNLDFYTHDGLEACKETMDYLSKPLPTPDHQPPAIHYSRLSYKQLQRDLEILEAQTAATLNPLHCQTPIEPNVYLTDEIDASISSIITQFSLNAEQVSAFRIIANHSLGNRDFGEQLRMGIFGEGRTGKSRLI
jgi:hypothetical protein